MECPEFWNSRKINITHVDFKNEKYMDNIQTAAYIGMSLNVAMVILFLITFKGKFKKLYKAYYTSTSWKCITFSSFFKRWFFVTFPFFEALSPLSDSILGRSLIRDARTSGSSTDWFRSVKYYVKYNIIGNLL